MPGPALCRLELWGLPGSSISTGAVTRPVFSALGSQRGGAEGPFWRRGQKCCTSPLGVLFLCTQQVSSVPFPCELSRTPVSSLTLFWASTPDHSWRVRGALSILPYQALISLLVPCSPGTAAVVCLRKTGSCCVVWANLELTDDSG